MSIIIAIVCYLLLGFILNNLTGIISEIILRRKWKMNKNEFIKALIQETNEGDGKIITKFTYLDWFMDIVTWPIVECQAIKGFIKLYNKNPRS